jgi:branched-chain amino acid transport system permease protein
VSNVVQNKYTRYGSLLAFAAILIILPRTWGGYWNYVFGTVGIYIILGLGLNIITGWAGQLVIGYVAFFAVGAYTFALLTAPEPHHLMLNFWVALGLGVLAAAISGLLIGLPILWIYIRLDIQVCNIPGLEVGAGGRRMDFRE